MRKFAIASVLAGLLLGTNVLAGDFKVESRSLKSQAQKVVSGEHKGEIADASMHYGDYMGGYNPYVTDRENVEKKFDTFGNLIYQEVTSKDDNKTLFKMEAEYNNDDKLVSRKHTYSDFSSEEILTYENGKVTTIYKDSNDVTITTEELEDNKIILKQKYDSNENLILYSETKGETPLYKQEYKYDDQNRIIYQKFTGENGWNERSVTYDADKVKEVTSGENEYTIYDPTQTKPEVDFTQEKDDNGNIILVKYIEKESEKVIYQSEYKYDDKNRMVYSKYTSEDGFWTETITEFNDTDKTITTISKNSEERVETRVEPINERYYIEDTDGIIMEDKDYGEMDDYREKYENYEDKKEITAQENISLSTNQYIKPEAYDNVIKDGEDEITTTGLGNLNEKPPVVPTTENGDSSIKSYLTKSYLDTLPNGWNLVGSSLDVDIDILKDAKSVFKYDAMKEKWDSYKPSEREDEEFMINAFEGFWINK